MKKVKLALVFGATLIAVVFSKSIRTSQEDFSPLEMANIEALSNPELENKCGGCSTSYNGPYCCTLVLYGVPYTLYHPKTLF